MRNRAGKQIILNRLGGASEYHKQVRVGRAERYDAKDWAQGPRRHHATLRSQYRMLKLRLRLDNSLKLCAGAASELGIQLVVSPFCGSRCCLAMAMQSNEGRAEIGQNPVPANGPGVKLAEFKDPHAVQAESRHATIEKVRLL